MGRKLKICSALPLLTIASSGIAQAPPATPIRPVVTISVYDYAHVPVEFLAAVEGDAGRIFRQVGVETVWISCLPKPAKIELPTCYLVDATHLMMKIPDLRCDRKVHLESHGRRNRGSYRWS